MIDIEKSKNSFINFLNRYEDKSTPGFELKVNHTYRVMANSKILAKKLNLNSEDILLAELIGLLHDIGRFEELLYLKKFDSVKFDHASHGVKMLFEDNLIREFVDDTTYDEIISKAINNHSRKEIQSGLTERELLHSKIIRDADKLDNFERIKTTEDCFPGVIESKEEVENSIISEKVYNAIINKECVDIKDRKTPLDMFICVLAFIFDLNFIESLKIVKEKDYINKIIDKFNYENKNTKEHMEKIRKILNDYINEKTKNLI